MHDDLLTIADVARRKNVTRSAVYWAIAHEQLSAQKVLGKLAVRVADADAWQPKARKGRRKGTPMSEEGKRRISQGQKRRWTRRKS